MPELPEVETIRQDLVEVIGCAGIEALDIGDPRVLRTQDFAPSAASGTRLRAIGRHGKYLVFDLGVGQMVVHLRMTGRLLPVGHPELPTGRVAKRRHKQFRFYLHTDRGPWVFFDTRRFGTLDLVSDAACWFRAKRLAPDPLLDREAARAHFVARMCSRRPVKAVLLDQSVACGVGNIYADEALFRTGIHPRRLASTLDDETRGVLFDTAVLVMREAIARRGTTTSDYLDARGEKGVFQKYLNVYRRAGLACRYCGAVIERQAIAGRSSHFCPGCQPCRGD